MTTSSITPISSVEAGVSLRHMKRPYYSLPQQKALVIGGMIF
nr:hypothetical protein [Okeania sp. SIO2F4]